VEAGGINVVPGQWIIARSVALMKAIMIDAYSITRVIQTVRFIRYTGIGAEWVVFLKQNVLDFVGMNGTMTVVQ